uniref:Uncharacterized protein n=1 Tax=Desulfurella acetivorans TaxID=33002 RepID=A0A832ADY5_DESAE
MSMAWLDFGGGFEIEKDNKNKIVSIKILNAKGTKEEEFIGFAALLRYFLNKNNFVDDVLLELTGFINKADRINDDKPLMVFTETYDVVLKTTPHNHRRYLEIETQKKYWYADTDVNRNEGYYDAKFKDFDKKIQMDFKPQKTQVPEIRAQVWLEALNKYRI